MDEACARRKSAGIKKQVEKLPASADGKMLAAMPATIEKERRASPRRRLRDRIASHGGNANRALARRHDLANLLMLVDDDLRETALALGGIEQYLGNALALIEKADLTREELSLLAGDDGVRERLDTLS